MQVCTLTCMQWKSSCILLFDISHQSYAYMCYILYVLWPRLRLGHFQTDRLQTGQALKCMHFLQADLRAIKSIFRMQMGVHTGAKVYLKFDHTKKHKFAFDLWLHAPTNVCAFIDICRCVVGQFRNRPIFDLDHHTYAFAHASYKLT